MNNDDNDDDVDLIPVKVALRIRPLLQKEISEGAGEYLKIDQTQVTFGRHKLFSYDYIFSKESTQSQVYETSVQPLLKSLFRGYNVSVIAYGQTSSGKTYTMGSMCVRNNDGEGVIPRVLTDLFNRTQQQQQQMNNSVTFKIKVSFVEIYNEDFKDLLCNAKQVEPLKIVEDNNSLKIMNLTEREVTNVAETRELLDKGTANRVTGGTAMNDQSSRSHAIFTIILEQRSEGRIVKSKFHLVDLAGSERQSKTKAEGMRFKEGININLGLLALGHVIRALSEDDVFTNKNKHIPYRESKLTRLLKDSLGGNSVTLMIACVSSADCNMEETLNTLRFADRGRKMENKPIINSVVVKPPPQPAPIAAAAAAAIVMPIIYEDEEEEEENKTTTNGKRKLENDDEHESSSPPAKKPVFTKKPKINFLKLNKLQCGNRLSKRTTTTTMMKKSASFPLLPQKKQPLQQHKLFGNISSSYQSHFSFSQSSFSSRTSSSSSSSNNLFNLATQSNLKDSKKVSISTPAFSSSIRRRK